MLNEPIFDISGLAGKKASVFTSDSATSTAVPNTGVVLRRQNK
jgi:hypothetical protein